MKMPEWTKEEKKDYYIRIVLDPIRILAQNASEEYGQYLDEFEAEFGQEEREKYEERYV